MYRPNIVKPLVYVAGPYSHPDPVENTNRAIRVGMELWETGKCGVLVPHMSLLAHMVTPKPAGYWYAWDVDQMLACDALYRMKGESEGADNEVSICHQHSIPVFWENVQSHFTPHVWTSNVNYDALLDFCDRIIKGLDVASA